MNVRAPRTERGSTLEVVVAIALIVGAAAAVTAALIVVAQVTGLSAWVPIALLLGIASLLLVFD